MFSQKRGNSLRGDTTRTTGTRSVTYAPNWSSSMYTTYMSNEIIAYNVVASCSLEFDQFKVSVTLLVPLCFKAYLGLSNRSTFYPGSSVGSTFTSGIVEDTCFNPISRSSFFFNAYACVLLLTCLPGSKGLGAKLEQTRTNVYGDPSTDTSQRSRRSKGRRML